MPLSDQQVDHFVQKYDLDPHQGGSFCCPSHDDNNASASLTRFPDGGWSLHCFAGCEFKEMLKAEGIWESWAQKTPKKTNKGGLKGTANLTLEEVAKVKSLPVEYLSSLGIRNAKSKDREYYGPHVEIPYGGHGSAKRRRLNAYQEPRFSWPRGTKANDLLYGTWLIPQFKSSNSNTLLIVEGESDCWTLWYHGYATLGCPGSGLFGGVTLSRINWATDIVLIAEPDDAGQKFVKDVPAHIVNQGYKGRIRIASLEALNTKDPSSYHCALVEKHGSPESVKPLFREDFDSIVEGAIDADLKSINRRPRIDIAGLDLHARSQATLEALQGSNDPPYMFVRDGRLVRIQATEEGRPRIHDIGPKTLRCEAVERFEFIKSSDQGVEVLSTPPAAIFDNILERSTLPFPGLRAIVETPVTRSNGTLLTRKGYDTQTRLYYTQAESLRSITVPDHPSREQAIAARDTLLDLLCDIPFAIEEKTNHRASRDNYLALLLTPFIRHAIGGLVPLAVIDAPQGGSGKSLLTRIASIIATGQEALQPGCDKEEEWSKTVMSSLMSGQTFIAFDNLSGSLSSNAFEAALTSPTFRARRLGSNDASAMIEAPNLATWVVTGNNLSLKNTFPRRCYWIRLDPRCERPEARTEFRYKNIIGHVYENRARYIEALLTMIRAWYASGCPGGNAPVQGGFAEWSRACSGILEHAGCYDFLQNRDRMLNVTNSTANEWAVFLEQWFAKYGSAELTIRELIAGFETDEEFRNAMPSTLIGRFVKGNSGFNVSLGKQLSANYQTQHGEYRLEKGDYDGHNRSQKWVIARVASIASGLSYRAKNPKGMGGDGHPEYRGALKGGGDKPSHLSHPSQNGSAAPLDDEKALLEMCNPDRTSKF